MDEKENLKKQKLQDVIKVTFADEIDRFIKHLDAQLDISPLVMKLINIKLMQESKHAEKFIKDFSVIEKQDEEAGGKTKLLIPEEKIKEFISLATKVEITNLAHDLLPVNFVVSFVSQFDAYLGGIIRAMFIAKPELLNSSEKNILFSELIKFDSIEEARDFIVEQEVESVLRESHLKQFKWLESKLNITLRKELPSFSSFIEITERRNLFVHCNGIISRQYIEVCKENNVAGIEKAKIGNRLNAKPKYLNKCYLVLFEIGVKLGHVIWRKLKPDEIEKADAHLNRVCYQLLLKEHYDLALNLLCFATDVLKKHHDQEVVCIFIINKALAYYLSNKKEDSNKVIDTHDWSATSDKFKLAVAVLKENYLLAARLMESIGRNNSHVDKSSYREWPLFKFFRLTDDFKKTYLKVFGEEFIYVESKPKGLDEILSELKEVKQKDEEAKILSNGPVNSDR